MKRRQLCKLIEYIQGIHSHTPYWLSYEYNNMDWLIIPTIFTKRAFNFITGALTGDLGTSYYTKIPVIEEILDRFPATIELAFLAIILASFFGIVIGVVSAVKKNSLFDNAGMLVALIGVSMTIFWLGILLIIFFSGTLHWLPSSGRLNPCCSLGMLRVFILLIA